MYAESRRLERGARAEAVAIVRLFLPLINAKEEINRHPVTESVSLLER